MLLIEFEIMTESNQGYHLVEFIYDETLGYFVMTFSDDGKYYGFFEYNQLKFSLYSRQEYAEFYPRGSGYLQRWHHGNGTADHPSRRSGIQGWGDIM